MKIFEIDDRTKKIKDQVEKWYIQFTISNDHIFKHEVKLNMLTIIDSVYPTGYDGVDSRLIQLKNTLQQTTIDILKK